MSTIQTDWERIPLEQISQRIDYGHTASADVAQVGPQFLRITDIQNGNVDWDAVPHCPATKAELDKYRLVAGDIVFARTGNTTGKSFLLKNPPNDSVFASYLIRVRPSNAIEPRFLAHFFDTPDYWNQIKKHAQGAGQPGVNATRLKQLSIPVPPLSEQKRIADILDKADAIRSKRQEAIDEIENLSVSAYLHRFGHPVEATNSVPMSDCVTILSGGTPSKRHEEYWNGDFPWVSPKDMKVDFINGAEDHVTEVAFEETTLKKLPIKSVLIVVRGMILAHTVPLAVTEVPVAINQDMKAMIANKEYDPLFLCWSMKAAHNYILGKVATAAHGTKRLEVEHISSFPVPKISLNAQKEFAKSVRMIRTTRKRFEDSDNDHLFNSLVQRAFMGEL